MMVVAVGQEFASRYLNELNALATPDSRGKPMMFPLKDFASFAHVAYYFHKGEL